MQVKSSGYQAEFGGSTGGVVNVVTKSGSNLFHGDVGTYFTNDSMCCDERPTLRLVLTGQNASEYVTLAEDDYSRVGTVLPGRRPDRRGTACGSTVATRRSSRTPIARSRSARTARPSTYESKEKTHYLTGNVTSQVTNNLRAQVRQLVQHLQAGRPPAGQGWLEQLRDELRRSRRGAAERRARAARSTTSPATTSF